MAARKPLTPAQRAAATQRQALYRERQKLTAAGKRIPKAIQPKRPATYRPPARPKSPQARKVAAVSARTSAAQRASDQATLARNLRARALEQLPQARNPKANIQMGRDQGRAVTRTAEAAKIRRASANQKIQAVGRRLKSDFRQADFEGIQEILTPSQQRRFKEITTRISKVSAQALAIYFHNEGGSGEFNVALKEIRYPVDGGDGDSGLDRLEDLANYVERAEGLYGEKAIGKLNI